MSNICLGVFIIFLTVLIASEILHLCEKKKSKGYREMEEWAMRLDRAKKELKRDGEKNNESD